MSLSGTTRLAGVVGRPVAHSLSPVLHNAWIAAAGLDAAYVAFPIAEGRLDAFIDGLRGGAVAGLNVTVPYKEDALALADVASERAHRAGAANLLVFDADGTVRADNTDGEGLLAALAEQAPALTIEGAKVVVLGAGGAAKGAVLALSDAGAYEVVIVNRTQSRAQALANSLRGPAVAAEWGSDLAFSDAALVVNATTLGLSGDAGPEVPFALLPPGAVVMDMVYRPVRTGLLEGAAAAGLTTVDGLAMLIGQARPSFEAFFDMAPPSTLDVRAVALAALGG
jgi:shikimate dehydrogenase